MSKDSTSNNRPAYRACFSARTGIDRNGQSTLSYPVEIGAAFHRKDAEKGLILKFNLVPASVQDGVLFLIPLAEGETAQTELFEQQA
ncbi:hypothetical protein [Hyphobacterium sp.]|uniref:hypothetical protein n=1 Tax=Hyphobacterium sp. TaxID=2004662 RepID=UPI003BAA1245